MKLKALTLAFMMIAACFMSMFVIDNVRGAPGDIADAVVDSFEWDTNQGEEVDAIRLGTSEYYLIAAAGSGDDGYLYTIRVWNSNGTIRQSVVDSWEYDTSDGQYPSLCYLEYTSGPARDYSIYALVYKDTTGGFGTSKIITVKVWSTNGTIWKTALDTLSVTSYLGNYHDIIHVTGDYYAFVSSRAADNDGFIKTVDIDDSNGAIGSIVDSVEFDTADCSYPRIVQVDSDTVAIVYSGPDQDGYLKTYNISAAGDITNTAADSWEFDTTYANYPFIKHISGDYFAIAYEGADSDGFVKTLTIADTGMITKSWIDELEFDTADCYYPTMFTVVDANDYNPGVYGITYKGTDGDGFVVTVDITSAGNIGSVIDSLEFDTADNMYYAPAIHIAGNFYVICYTGTGYDGWAVTIEIDSSSLDPIDVELSFSNWNAGNPGLGNDTVLSSLTLWQNGSSNIDVTIGVNATNLSFVSYSTWAGNGHLQYCMNYTVGGTEYNMADVSHPFTNSLASDMEPGSLSFSLRLWMPKTIASETLREDFKIVFTISEST